MELGAIPSGEFLAMMREKQVYLRTGPLTLGIGSEIPSLSEKFHSLYRYHSLLEGEIPHMWVDLRRSRGLRRFVRSQASVCLDGAPIFLPMPYDFALPLFEWGMNYCVYRQVMNHLALHSAALEYKGRGFLFAGISGSGKSTLCAYLMLRAWRLLSDEISLIRLSDGLLQPNPRPVGLKDDSIALVRSLCPEPDMIAPEAFNEERGTIAHLRPSQASVVRQGECVPPGFLIFVHYQSQGQASCTPVLPGQAFFQLARESFNYGTLGLPGFHAMSQFVERTKFFELRYSKFEEAEEFLQRLEENSL